MKTLSKSSLSYVTITVLTGVLLTGGACGSKNKSQLKTRSNQVENSNAPNAIGEQNPKKNEEATQPVSASMHQAEQAYKEAKKYLKESEQTLAHAGQSTTQSELEKFKQTIKDVAQKADQAAKTAEAAAQAAVDSKTHDAQQTGEYAQAARIAANTALENAKKVEAMQLRYYYSAYYAEKPNQAVQSTPKPNIANRITENPQDRTNNLDTKLNNIKNAIVEEITAEVTAEVEKISEKISENTSGKAKKTQKGKNKVTSLNNRTEPNQKLKELNQLEKKVLDIQNQILDRNKKTKKDIPEQTLKQLEAKVKEIEEALPVNIKNAIEQNAIKQKKEKTKKKIKH